MNDTCLQFAWKFAEYKGKGNSVIDALIAAANDFKKEIKYMAVGKKESGIRSYLFTDNSYCIYNMEEGYFKFRSPKIKPIC